MPSRTELDACAIVTSDEIAEITGERPTETKKAHTEEQGLTVTQCFYQLPTYVNSIELRIVQKSADPGSRNPRQVWKETFAADKLHEAGRRAPAPIENVGEEAFWRTQKKSGALYVLKGDTYVRVSVAGGEDDSETKIRKCSDVALKALSRL